MKNFVYHNTTLVINDISCVNIINGGKHEIFEQNEWAETAGWIYAFLSTVVKLRFSVDHKRELYPTKYYVCTSLLHAIARLMNFIPLLFFDFYMIVERYHTGVSQLISLQKRVSLCIIVDIITKTCIFVDRSVPQRITSPNKSSFYSCMLDM